MSERDPTPTHKIRVAVRAARRNAIGADADATESVSMTRQIRAGRARRHRRFVPERAPVVHVSPWRDAAFPALVSLLFTGPVAVRWIAAGSALAAIAIALGGVLVAFGSVFALSPWLDGGDD